MIPGIRSTAKQDTRWDTQDLAWDQAKESRQTVALDLLNRLRACPSTCDELEIQTGLTHQTCSAAVNWLMNNGKIVPCGYRVTRSRRSARVWRVAESGDSPVTRRRNRKHELRELSDRVKLLQEQIVLLTHERDDARRIACEYACAEAVFLNLDSPLTLFQAAQSFGWNCFKGDNK
jgi:hypothetical protein